MYRSIRPAAVVFVRVASVAFAFANCVTFQHLSPLTELQSGTYPLLSFNEHRVPVAMGILGPKGGQGATCRLMLVEGALTLDTTLNTFSYYFDIREGCERRLVSRETVSGTFQRDGARFTFRIPGADRSPSFRGTVEARRIVLSYNDELVFARTPIQASSPQRSFSAH